jgi:pimeloyl-ACP methyl ester carboxylesterase
MSDAIAKEAVDAPDCTSVFVTAQDGLRLHVRSYRPRDAGGLPVVCLPGLARTEGDFAPLARALAADPEHARRVIALDYRGRGRSDRDRDARNYSLPVELSDLLAVLTALEIGPAVFVGTSRGGLLAMLLASARPTAIAGVVLNDIGPVIEAKGLMRIRGYLGKLPQPKTVEEGGEILRRLFDAQFPTLTAGDWRTAASRMWEPRDGRLTLTYDVRLADNLMQTDLERPLPTMWKDFDALARLPLMLVRGINSDILSVDTVAAMRARRPDLVLRDVPDQGHAPLLAEPDVIGAIAAFVAGCEAAQH